MEVAVNVNLNAVSFLLCSIFTNNLINCQQDQQNQCEGLQPSGWESGLDSSGVRTTFPLGLVSRGTNVTWTCPGQKHNAADGKNSWVGACVENPSLPGYTVFDYSWPGSAWPECECRPLLEAGGCRMEGAEGSAEYNMRYVYTVGGGDLPGIDVTVPLPITGKIIAWRVKIAWDLKTVDRRIQVTSRSKGIRMERADFVGTEYEFRPLNSSYINNNPISIDLGFNFLEDAVRADTKKWHYPCVANMECSVTIEEETDLMALAMVIGASLGLVFLFGCCCASCVWVMKNDGSYTAGGVERLVSAYSIRTVYDQRDKKKVRPHYDNSDA